MGKALQAILDELGRRLLLLSASAAGAPARATATAGGGGVDGGDNAYPVVVVASCDEGVEDLCHPIRRCFTHELPVPVPGERRRREVGGLMEGVGAVGCMCMYVDVHHIASQPPIPQKAKHTQPHKTHTKNKQVLRHALARLGPHIRFFPSSSSPTTTTDPHQPQQQPPQAPQRPQQNSQPLDPLPALVRRTAGRTPAELCALVDASVRRALGRYLVLPSCSSGVGEGGGQGENRSGGLGAPPSAPSSSSCSSSSSSLEGGRSSGEEEVVVEEADWAAAERALGAVAPSAVPTPKVRSWRRVAPWMVKNSKGW